MSTPRHEPHKIKTVRPIAFPSFEERKRALVRVDFNTYHLTPAEITLDMGSHGTSAMSQEQVAGQYLGDEAYAGALNFEVLERNVAAVLGLGKVCPTHNALGSLKLYITTHTRPGQWVLTNAAERMGELEGQRMVPQLVREGAWEFSGDANFAALETAFSEGDVAFVLAHTYADGQHPVSLAGLKKLREWSDSKGVILYVDLSRVVENAGFIRDHEEGQAGRSLAEIVKELAQIGHVAHVDGAQDPRANIGGFIATNNADIFEKVMNEVVLYEGLHTYGGMAGRTMEVLARGLAEMCDEEEAAWIAHQSARFCARLQVGGVPMVVGCDGAYLNAAAILRRHWSHQTDALSAALYLTTGMRAVAHGKVGACAMLPVQIPRLSLTNDQLDQVADAIIALVAVADQIGALDVIASGNWQDQMRYRWVLPDLKPVDFDFMPYVIHTIERVGRLDRAGREVAVRAAGYNTFLLRSADVVIDLLTDSGTTAMSTTQWSRYEAAAPSAATSDAIAEFRAAMAELTGYKYLIPTHQGRAAEHILSQIMIQKGQYVPGNMYFTTTKEHQELAGGIFADIIVDEAHQPESTFPWKGNIDLRKLDALVEQHGASQIAYISFEFSVNMAGGQPVSIDNMREVYAYCTERKIPVLFDSTRMVENAYMIQKKDSRYAGVKVADIVREMLSYGDGMTVSGKKDFLINIGGLLAFRDNADWAAKAEEMLRAYEGRVTDGGLAAHDLAAIAQGVRETVQERYIRARVEQTQYLGERLMALGVPIVTPPGTHAIFIDVKRFLPHIDQDQYPAQRLAAEIYVETGVRPMERGNVSKGRKPNGENYRPALELVRLTLSRRVYTRDHMDAIAEGIARLYARRDTIQGLRFTYEPAHLRFFQSRFELVD